MCFDRTFPAAAVVDVARRLDHRVDQLWVIEDCFYTAGVSLAASALSVSERLTVGIGILPAVARNPAITAMEIATLCGLGPGRVLPGIGHGVQSWMAQMGTRPRSPVRALDEVMTAVGRLLAGEKVTTHGEYVHLDDVQLYHPPADVPPLLAGVRGPKSMAMAGRVAGGVLLAEPASPSYVRLALEQAGHPSPFHVGVFSVVCIEPERKDAYRAMAPWLAGLLDEPSAGVRAWPFVDELLARYTRHGVDSLVTMPREWWTHIAPIGTAEDALEHVEALEAEGVESIGMYPARDLDIALGQIDHIAALAQR